MELKRGYKGILSILKTKFGKIIREKNKDVAEVLLLLALGYHLGQDTISAICAKLKIPKHQIYNKLKKMSIKEWRDLFRDVFKRQVKVV